MEERVILLDVIMSEKEITKEIVLPTPTIQLFLVHDCVASSSQNT
ncbi:MAG: hypothetical protein WC758_00760 [Candidatus Woesearchaeota archaeon]|jgi:hypothetical protein